MSTRLNANSFKGEYIKVMETESCFLTSAADTF